MIKKYFNLKALDVDSKTRRVKVAISEVESLDKDNDVFEPSAFDKTMKERGPQGSDEIWHLLDHDKTSFSALSKFTELGREGNKIAGVSLYKNSFAWREVAWPIYEAGEFNQHSVGFQTVKQEFNKAAGYNVIKEVMLYEGSAVLWGANPNTPTMQLVKSLMDAEEDREITAAEKIDEIIKSLKKGRFDEERQSLLVIELKRLQGMCESKQLHTIYQEPTQPELKSVEPEVNDAKLLEAIKQFTQSLKQK